MKRTALHLVLALGVTSLCGCEEDLTEVLLVVDADVCAPALGRVSIEVDATPAGGSRAMPVSFDASGGLPRALAIVHRGGALGPVDVTVRGELAGGATVERLARFRFVEGSTRVLRIVLEQACAGMSCATEGETCIGGACAPAEVSESALAPYPSADAGGTCAPPIDAGMDAPPPIDAGPDATTAGCEVEGTFDCNGTSTDGCESALRDPVNCGACGVPCARPRGSVSCETGVCSLLACEAGARDCNTIPDDGCESDLRDLENCGGCGIPCALPHAVASCGSGACTIISCETGYDNCDGRPENGCETDVRSNATHCGRCDNACAASPAHAVTDCADSRCSMVCDAGWADCDTRADTGCEGSLADPSSCGDCAAPCPGASPLCGGNATTGFMCVSTCSGGATRCDDSCVNLDMNPLHCGRCGMVCADEAHAAGICTGGSCALQCDPGWGDCNGSTSDGCETPLESTSNCGMCGRSCTRPNASATCAAGSCQIDVCTPGFDDCNTIDADGCEAPLDTTADCGACDVACTRAHATATCSGGACRIASCDADFDNCNSTDSDGCETDTRADDENCGGCGRRCSGEMCRMGSCDVLCSPGIVDCNMDPMDGCETDTLTDPANCGACMMTCPPRASSVPSCEAGECSFVCNAGFGDCTMAAGCETDLTTSTMHCGACGSGCPMGSHAMNVVCTATGCEIVECDAGFGDCDGNVTNGCEVRLSNDPAHCGMCGRACVGMERCTASVCR